LGYLLEKSLDNLFRLFFISNFFLRFEKQNKTPMEYCQFIETKKKKAIKIGFNVNQEDLNPKLKDFQRFIVSKALEHGKYALFADTGLGKTFMQLEWAFHVSQKTNQPVLILAPLAVVGQTINEAKKWGLSCEHLKSNVFGFGVFITNYDQLENIDANQFSGIVLDESSILKNESGSTRNAIIDAFKYTPYKLACSATPSPNDHMELGNHAEFLDVCTYHEMLAQYFVHDGGETSKWRLRKHAESDFWNFVLSWAIAIDNPKTFGYDGTGYDLQEVNYIEHLIDVASDKNDLFGEAIVSATDLHKELKASQEDRFKTVLEIINQKPNDQFLIWGLSNIECDALQKLIKGSVNVKGSDTPDQKAKNLLAFGDGQIQYLITKTSIAGMGLNYQNANNMIFLAYDFSFEKFYQGVRRMHRFGQNNQVNVHILTPKNQINVKSKILESEKKHKQMIKELAKKSSEFKEFRNDLNQYQDVITNDFKCLIGDCVQRAKDIKDNELDLVVFSPPFAELYVYSDKPEDMGNVANYKEFEDHFQFLIPEIKRTLKAGRICAIHCMDLPIQKGKEGFIGLRDFSGMLIKWFSDQGFIYHARTTIWKNPVTEMQRTKALGLLHKTIKKDSSMSRVGIPDYVLFFRNEGQNETPITHQDTNPHKPDYLPVDLWQKYASPVWYDVDYSRTLQYTTARDSNDEKHICPLQLDTIERVIHLYSNEAETVGSFFGGIGSEGFQALKMGRKSVSIELKESYFRINVQNHKNAVLQKSTLTLF
jgi:DNA modification methylase